MWIYFLFQSRDCCFNVGLTMLVFCLLNGSCVICGNDNSTCESHDNSTGHHLTRITDLLDSLLEDYNKHLRPDMGESSLPIEMNLLIRSMGPISEEDMMFSMDCYFRQEWRDKRLKFEPLGSLDILRPSIKMLDKIWKPDTFILNGQNSYLHTITYSNKLFRIKHSGDILYSQRLTVKSSCPMHLQKYPLDSQTCPLLIGSFGYSKNDVTYRWKPNMEPSPVRVHKDITMAQFSLTDITHGSGTLGASLGDRSVLTVQIGLKREIGYYLLQIYLPCYLIVIISWISFWINREATPARVMLGITTLLTTCTIALTGREGIPKVSYSTALDVFLMMCFSFVFAAIVEYAGVNYFTVGSGKEAPDDSDDECEPSRRPLIPPYTTHPALHPEANGHNTVPSAPTTEYGCWLLFIHCLQGDSHYRNTRRLQQRGPLSVSRIDSFARVIFPFTFVCLNVLYWAGFIYYF